MDKNPQHIWLIRGYAGSGKDTAAQLLANLLGPTSAAIGSFAAAVKDEVAILYGYERNLLDTAEGKQRLERLADGRTCTVRDLIIEHAEGEKVQTGDPAVWARRVSPPSNILHWILSDWRFGEEYAALRQRFSGSQFHTLHVSRPGVVPLDTYTEHSLDGVHANVMLENSGSLLYLGNQIKQVLEELGLLP